MFCKHCGNGVSRDFAFCIHCGKAIEAAAQQPAMVGIPIAPADGRKFLKVTGILFIVFGGLAFFGAIIGLAFIGATTGALRQIGMPNIFSPARAVLVFGLFTSAYQIFIGIMGIRDHANYAKAPLLYAFGVVDLALVIIGLIISGFVWTVIFSLPLPILFIIGAHKNLAFSGQTTNIQEVLQTALAAITKPTPPTVHMPYHPPAPAPEPAPEVNPAGCLHCGNIMNDDDLFCSGCGQKRAAL